MASDWANLPKDLLDLVLERSILSSRDYLRFSIVCKTWFSVAKENQSRYKKMLSHQEPPMLIFFNAKKDAWSLYNVLDNKILDDFHLKMPNKRFFGSSKGWLIVVEEDFTVTLINPFLRSKEMKTHLPQVMPPDLCFRDNYGSQTPPEDYDHYVLKPTMTADPISNPNKCIIILTDIGQSEIAFIRIGEDKWSFINTKVIAGHDIIQHGDKFCTLEMCGNMITFDITSESYSDVNKFACLLPPVRGRIRDYLVHSHDNELLLIIRRCGWEDLDNYDKRFTKESLVFKFDFGKRKWIEKTSLGDR